MNRYYYYNRSPYSSFGQTLTPVVKMLLATNVAFFIVQMLDVGHLMYFLALVPSQLLSRFFIWQPVTYMFLHAGVMHLLLNMFILYFFGREVEHAIGSRRLCVLYFLSGIGAGLCSAFLTSMPHIPVVGASGAIYGLMVAYAFLFPHRTITLLLFFVIPISMQARQMVAALMGIELLYAIANVRGDMIAHVAHLGGGVCGYFYMKRLQRGRR